ncbi:uncharacterized protein LOC142344512 [Convolutriloba macropyga]|uniref:uncharacterized protein LOC142344512 n=1 Tax=Convolutriloba macropyga TaxID=536237 RepID=UPI003F523A5F
MEIKSARFMEKEHSRMWRDEIDARGYVAKEIHVAMNDNRVVIVTAEHQHGHHEHSKRKLFHEFIVPGNVDPASLKSYFDEKRGFVVITGIRNDKLLQQQPGVPYSAMSPPMKSQKSGAKTKQVSPKGPKSSPSSNRKSPRTPKSPPPAKRAKSPNKSSNKTLNKPGTPKSPSNRSGSPHKSGGSGRSGNSPSAGRKSPGSGKSSNKSNNSRTPSPRRK